MKNVPKKRRIESLMTNRTLTGKPSIDKPWMKYYPPMLANLEAPECTLNEYLAHNCPGPDVIAMHYYGIDIQWKTVIETADAAARSMQAIGFGEGDQIPVFLSSVPEFVFMLLLHN